MASESETKPYPNQAIVEREARLRELNDSLAHFFVAFSKYTKSYSHYGEYVARYSTFDRVKAAAQRRDANLIEYNIKRREALSKL